MRTNNLGLYIAHFLFWGSTLAMYLIRIASIYFVLLAAYSYITYMVDFYTIVHLLMAIVCNHLVAEFREFAGNAYLEIEQTNLRAASIADDRPTT